jgi:putative ABC transport system permease protein
MAFDTCALKQAAFGAHDSGRQCRCRYRDVHGVDHSGPEQSVCQADRIVGSNTIWCLKFDPSFGRQPSSEELHRKELTIEDADAIRNEAPSVAGVAPFYRKIAETVSYRDKQSDTPILLGVSPYHEFVLSSYVGYGRYVTDLDVEQRSNVCVLGRDVVHALFPNEDPIDKEMKIAGRVFRVVGVMEPLGSFLGQSRDNSLYIPITTFKKYYPEMDFRTSFSPLSFDLLACICKQSD